METLQKRWITYLFTRPDGVLFSRYVVFPSKNPYLKTGFKTIRFRSRLRTRYLSKPVFRSVVSIVFESNPFSVPSPYPNPGSIRFPSFPSPYLLVRNSDGDGIRLRTSESAPTSKCPMKSSLITESESHMNVIASTNFLPKSSIKKIDHTFHYLLGKFW